MSESGAVRKRVPVASSISSLSLIHTHTHTLTTNQ
jgi:hypothetical protein